MIQHLISNGQYRKAAEKIANLHQEIHPSSNVFVLDNLSQRVTETTAVAQKQFVEQAREHFLSLIYNPLESYQAASTCIILAHSTKKRKAFIEEFLPYASLSRSFCDEIKWVNENAELIVHTFLTISAALEDGFFNRVELSIESANTLSRGLSSNAKASLSKAFQSVFSELDEGDVFYYSAMAFIRLVFNNYVEPEHAVQDKRVLNAYQDIRGVYPAMARNLYDSLIKNLAEDSSVCDLSLFGPYAGSHQKVLLDYLSEGSLSNLRRVLVARIERLLNVAHTDLTKAKQEWIAHGKMIAILKELKGDSRHVFSLSISKIAKRSRRVFDNYVSPLLQTSDIEKFNFHKILKDKNFLINHVMCLKMLGQECDIEALDSALMKLTAIQRKLVLQLKPSAATEQFIAISYDLIRLAGTKEQAKHSDNLVHAWHVYCSDVASSLLQGEKEYASLGLDVRQQAEFDALDDYVAQLDGRIFGYFLHHFTLDKKFVEQANSLRELIEQKDGFHLTNLSESNLCDLLKGSQKPLRWHWHTPKLKDAEQLLVGLIISAKAHQWVACYKTNKSEAQNLGPEQLCSMLKELAIELMHKFGVGHGRFTTHLASAIGAANDYFICPSGSLDPAMQRANTSIRH